MITRRKPIRRVSKKRARETKAAQLGIPASSVHKYTSLLRRLKVGGLTTTSPE